jgi:hypothetical protein
MQEHSIHHIIHVQPSQAKPKKKKQRNSENRVDTFWSFILLVIGIRIDLCWWVVLVAN